MTVFLRVLDSAVEDKPAALQRAVRGLRDAAEGGDPTVFECDASAFSAIPGSPFAYWAPNAILRIFQRLSPFESGGRVARITNPVADNFRFLRTWWETQYEHDAPRRWTPLFKGGAYSTYYFDPHLLVQWDQARQTYVGFVGTSHRPLEKPACAERFLHPGITWPVRTSGLSFRIMPKGCIFSSKGPAAFIDGAPSADILAILAVLNSQAFGHLVGVQLARTELAQSYEVGIIQQTPVPDLSDKDSAALAHLARRAWSLKRSLDTVNETSHAFLLPPGLNEKVTGLDRGAVERELESIQREVNEAAFRLYGIGSEDLAAFAVSSKNVIASNGAVDDSGDEEEDPGEGEAPEGAAGDAAISWLVGVAFGRFDSRLATGERLIPQEPEPFDPVPPRSCGMWPESEEPNLLRMDILVDDPGHNDDICARVADAAMTTGLPDPHDLRPWLARDFFALHVKMYSKSRRKAPIYWQLATTSASYSVWLYIHAFTKDTLFRVQNDYAAPKLAHEERRLEGMTRELREKSTAGQRKEVAVLESFIEELRAFLEEVKRVAPLWNPNLDDGVTVNFAPLWRLVPHHKLWQQELKATWDAICEGKRDWAHLAMHLWPERVVPKCASDRSLAIAHGLEEVFWVRGSNGKWLARKTPVRPIEELVRERTSLAAKAALNSLIDAPIATSKGRAGGGRLRAAVTGVEGGNC